ncbi:unnamed protein product [Peniophora sp. CBMAI 1063]|nr:unnamed protein product [Peniophora sp. CBMAI 1063]
MSTPKTNLYEVITASATEAYAADNTIFDEGLALMATQTSYPILSGPQIDAPAEEPKISVFIGWSSIEEHLAARESQAHAPLMPIIAKVFASKPDVIHVPFTSDPLPALRAPVTEIAWFTAKADASDKETGDNILQVVQQLVELSGSRGVAVSTGQVVERPGQVVCVAGWESIEAHQAFTAKRDPAFAPFFGELLGLAGATIGHSALKAYGGVA